MAKTPSQDALGDWAQNQARLINISQLAKRSNLDRATVRTRLEAAHLRPRKVLKKETFYDEKEALAALSGPAAVDTSRLKTVQAQKISVSTARELLKLQQERGELVPIADMREYAYAFVKAMHDRFKRYGNEAKRQLKLTAQQSKQMEADISLIFDDLKRDHPEIF